MSFNSLIPYFFLVLSNIALSGWTTVYPSPTEGYLGFFFFQVLAIMNTAAVKILVQVFVWT